MQRQKKTPIRVIIGNPPYSVGQDSANDNAQNQKYAKLDHRIASTYAKLTKATNKNSLYDSYIKAFRWATDRLANEGGVVAYVSNGSWIDGNAQDGMRKSLEKEFTSVHVFNLRGNARTSGELRKKEAGNVFLSGSRTPIAITLLVKNPERKAEKADIYYHDIGDYLSREQKLKIISDSRSASRMEWLQITPDERGDWLNLRNDAFDAFIPLAPEKKFDAATRSFFVVNSSGVKTQRDAWAYNYSTDILAKNIGDSIKFYNSEVDRLAGTPKNKVKTSIDYDPTKMSWSDSLIQGIAQQKKLAVNKNHFRAALYRPFSKHNLYYDRSLNERVYQNSKLFPLDDKKLSNLVICVSGAGMTKGFSTLITDTLPDIQNLPNGQCFPLYYYEESKNGATSLFGGNNDDYVRHDGVSDFILAQAQNRYGSDITKEDIFYYVYGLLHSTEYRGEFANDLRKTLPRIELVPQADDFWAFSKAGRKLAELHINYEEVAPYESVRVSGTQHNNYHVDKLRFASKNDKSKILYNAQITIENIPDQAYEYIVNGRSAIEWILDRYQVKTDKASGIVNDPNDWAKEVGHPRYILDLLLSVINVSVQTVDIVNNLPKIEFGK